MVSLANPARPFGLQDLLDAPGDGYWYEVVGADLVRKRALYAEAGCPNYWIVDPAGPTVTVLRLDADGYHESVVAEWDTEIVVDQPFPIRVRPADL